MHNHDVLVPNARQTPGLLERLLDIPGPSVRNANELDGDMLLKRRMERPVDGAEGTATDLVEQVEVTPGPHNSQHSSPTGMPPQPFARLQAPLRPNNLTVPPDIARVQGLLQRTEVNAWGVMHVLHTFTGMSAASPRNQRDWILTTVWAISMDAVAAGLIFMVFSSYIMWYRLKAKRVGGTIALALGFVICGAFVAGLGWLM